MVSLNEIRSYAMELAALQRVAFAVAHSTLPAAPSLSAPIVNTVQSQPAAQLSALLSKSIAATLEPCPWLGMNIPPSELPFYLWDV